MAGPIMKWSLGKNKKKFHIPYFWKGYDKLQGYAC
jgi:hypothetical protein